MVYLWSTLDGLGFFNMIKSLYMNRISPGYFHCKVQQMGLGKIYYWRRLVVPRDYCISSSSVDKLELSVRFAVPIAFNHQGRRCEKCVVALPNGSVNSVVGPI